jgi:CRP-like cAMP-binding protein
VEAGEEIVREGEPGDRYYVVADGELEVSADGAAMRTLGRGEGFGEIALLRSVRRTATVTARTAARLYTLDREPFLAAVAVQPLAAERVVAERLAAGQATIAP